MVTAPNGERFTAYLPPSLVQKYVLSSPCSA